eukprot:scaffold49026_cov29-Tisochrysis_lutea.AAC.2
MRHRQKQVDFSVISPGSRGAGGKGGGEGGEGCEGGMRGGAGGKGGATHEPSEIARIAAAMPATAAAPLGTPVTRPALAAPCTPPPRWCVPRRSATRTAAPGSTSERLVLSALLERRADSSAARAPILQGDGTSACCIHRNHPRREQLGTEAQFGQLGLANRVLCLRTSARGEVQVA